MKNAFHFHPRTFLLLVSLSAFVFTSCDEDGEDNNSDALTNEEAVALVEGAVSPESAGFTQELESAAAIADEYLEKNTTVICDESFDTTLTWEINRPRITANYAYAYSWSVNCNENNIPTSVTFITNSQGTYETNRLLSDDQANGDWIVENLITGANYIVSGSYVREGSQNSKVRDQNAFTSIISVTIDEITVQKGTRDILSGSGSYLVTGQTTGGESFRIEGDLVYNGNGTITVTINGEEYIIEW